MAGYYRATDGVVAAYGMTVDEATKGFSKIFKKNSKKIAIKLKN